MLLVVAGAGRDCCTLALKTTEKDNNAPELGHVLSGVADDISGICKYFEKSLDGICSRSTGQTTARNQTVFTGTGNNFLLGANNCDYKSDSFAETRRLMLAVAYSCIVYDDAPSTIHFQRLFNALLSSPLILKL